MNSLKIALIIITAVLFLFNLYFITENQKLNKRIAILESQIKSFQSENENYPTPKKEDSEYQELVDSITKDWNVYWNEEYRFEIKYPEKDDVNKANCEWKNCTAYFYQSGFDIHIYNRNSKESLLNHVKKSVYPFEAGDLENIYVLEIDDKKAYQIVASVDFPIISTFVENENYIYKLFTVNPKTPEDIITYNQIISTFKFTEE